MKDLAQLINQSNQKILDSVNYASELKRQFPQDSVYTESPLMLQKKIHLKSEFPTSQFRSCGKKRGPSQRIDEYNYQAPQSPEIIAEVNSIPHIEISHDASMNQLMYENRERGYENKNLLLSNSKPRYQVLEVGGVRPQDHVSDSKHRTQAQLFESREGLMSGQPQISEIISEAKPSTGAKLMGMQEAMDSNRIIENSHDQPREKVVGSSRVMAQGRQEDELTLENLDQYQIKNPNNEEEKNDCDTDSWMRLKKNSLNYVGSYMTENFVLFEDIFNLLLKKMKINNVEDRMEYKEKVKKVFRHFK